MGTRTHDNQNHNLGLYQLSYSHRCGANYSERPTFAGRVARARVQRGASTGSASTKRHGSHLGLEALPQCIEVSARLGRTVRA